MVGVDTFQNVTLHNPDGTVNNGTVLVLGAVA
jgi:hypothetical protein